MLSLCKPIQLTLENDCFKALFERLNRAKKTIFYFEPDEVAGGV